MTTMTPTITQCGLHWKMALAAHDYTLIMELGTDYEPFRFILAYDHGEHYELVEKIGPEDYDADPNVPLLTIDEADWTFYNVKKRIEELKFRLNALKLIVHLS